MIWLKAKWYCKNTQLKLGKEQIIYKSCVTGNLVLEG